jgi:hypothetical protein
MRRFCAKSSAKRQGQRLGVKKGGYLLKQENSWTKTGYTYDIMDLSETSIPNYFDIHYFYMGRRSRLQLTRLKKHLLLRTKRDTSS